MLENPFPTLRLTGIRDLVCYIFLTVSKEDVPSSSGTDMHGIQCQEAERYYVTISRQATGVF